VKRPRSLGLRTDLIFFGGDHPDDGRIEDRADHLVLSTPRNPTFYWGNFLLFEAPPAVGDGERWESLFREAFTDQSQATHRAYAWDGTSGERGAANEELAGFEVFDLSVLTCSDPVDPGVSGIEVRALEGDEDWRLALELQIEGRDPCHAPATYNPFKTNQMAAYRRLAERGRGAWYGAFIEGRMVADLGIFTDGQGLGRYQAVETQRDFRRRGVARTLVHRAGRAALERADVETLVIVADADGGPRRVYEAVGFREVERQVAANRWEGMPGA